MVEGANRERKKEHIIDQFIVFGTPLFGQHWSANIMAALWVLAFLLGCVGEVIYSLSVYFFGGSCLEENLADFIYQQQVFL